jgi:Na+/H+ antiporter NhaD/arsenite permease-like protein
MGFNAIVSLIIFVVVMALIISEKLNRTVAALSGASILIVMKLLSGEEALGYIDFNTLGVLIGMMIIVGIVKNTGVFEYLAILAAKKSKGDPWKILLSLCIITAVISAFLDNVTTVLLIAPMTFIITSKLDLDPIPFLIPEAIASNIGGTATLIGDPPNIMIGSKAGLDFMDFMVNLTPIIIVVFIATFAVLRFVYRNKFKVTEEQKNDIMKMDEKICIKNVPLLIKSLVVFALILVGFFLHSQFGYPSSVVALAGATLLLLASGENIDEAMHSIEWSTLFFFSGLFIMVGALQSAGLIDLLAKGILGFTGDNLLLTGIVIIWFSAIFSAFLDNIPFVATLIPLIVAMGQSGMNIAPLWWAVSLGACLGGNGTLIGASANVVIAGLSEKQGHKITFARYFKTGFPLMLLSVAISTIYLVIFYLR